MRENLHQEPSARKEKAGSFFLAEFRPVAGSGFDSVSALSQYVQANSPINGFFKPVMLDLELTHRCTQSCPQCLILDDVERSEFGLEVPEVVRVLREAAKLGFYCYSISGGEPFSRLNDVIDIIATVPGLDCAKIQTNGAYFSSSKKTLQILTALRRAGFGTNNRLICSALNVSVGIQNYSEGVPLQNVLHVLRAFPEVFGDCQATMSLILTHDARHTAVEAHENLVLSLMRAGGADLMLDNISVRCIPIRGSSRFTLQEDEQLPFGELLIEKAKSWQCISNHGLETPWPRMLVRAKGEVYTCSCFGHVFTVGNIRENGLAELLERANRHPLFSIVGQHSIFELLRQAEAGAAGFASRPVARSKAICELCATMRDAITAGPQLVQIGSSQPQL